MALRTLASTSTIDNTCVCVLRCNVLLDIYYPSFLLPVVRRAFLNDGRASYFSSPIEHGDITEKNVKSRPCVNTWEGALCEGDVALLDQR